MDIINGIAYADEPVQPIKVSGVRPLEDYRLWVRFGNGEAKVYDFKPLISTPAFAPLADEAVFRQVYIDFGAATWCDGEIDIAPEELYSNGIPVPASIA